MEVSVLQRLLSIELNQKITKLMQNSCPHYRECPLYGASVLERFHCANKDIGKGRCKWRGRVRWG